MKEVFHKNSNTHYDIFHSFKKWDFVVFFPLEMGFMNEKQEANDWLHFLN